MHTKILVALLFSIFLLFPSCRKAEQQASEKAVMPTLTVGMMSAVDAAPFYVALESGYFQEAGVLKSGKFFSL